MTLRRNFTETAILLLLFIGTFVLLSCEGPMGPPGRDAEGVDVVPPTIALTQPWPMSTVWDSFKVSVAAVDNVAIRYVSVMIDGSVMVGGQLLIDEIPPYTSMVTGLTRDWHFVSARAYDIAGNVTDSPVVPVWFGFSRDMSDTTVSLSYHNGDVDSVWAIPNNARATAYWMRFNPARDCILQRVGLMAGGIFSDTMAVMTVALWEGAGLPQTEIENGGRSLSGVSINGDIDMRWFDFTGDIAEGDTLELEGRNDYFLVVSLDDISPGDTLLLGFDDGVPPWGRCGGRDDVGWHDLTERYAKRNNLIITCELYYDYLEPDTTQQ